MVFALWMCNRQELSYPGYSYSSNDSESHLQNSISSSAISTASGSPSNQTSQTCTFCGPSTFNFTIGHNLWLWTICLIRLFAIWRCRNPVHVCRRFLILCKCCLFHGLCGNRISLSQSSRWYSFLGNAGRDNCRSESRVRQWFSRVQVEVKTSQFLELFLYFCSMISNRYLRALAWIFLRGPPKVQRLLDQEMDFSKSNSHVFPFSRT